MNILDIIKKKRKKEVLNKEEIDFFVKNFIKKNIKDYQMSSLLMAITLNGMLEEEIFNLTNAFLETGKIIKIKSKNFIPVDKHSTGGVGDKISIPLVPIIASLGVPFPMMSGRSLGHTGGTLDKLESIPNFKTNLSINKIKNQIKNIGCCFFSQNKNLVIADKKIYDLRNATETVESIPLIASSIMSKKISEGTKALVMDIKVGNGAFLETIEECRILADIIKKIGKNFSIKVKIIISDMNQPLGKMIGNSLEILESIEILKNKSEKDIKELLLEIGAELLILSGRELNKNKAKELIEENIKNGKALNKLEEIIIKQKGDPEILNNVNILNISKKKISIKSKSSGYINYIKTKQLGNIVKELGGGRNHMEESIDNSVGIEIIKKLGDYIKEKEELCIIYYNSEKKLEELIEKTRNSFFISEENKEHNKIILEIF